MAEQLDQEIRTITRERNEREAVLVSMIEGVIAVDTDDHVIALNQAAAGPAWRRPRRRRGSQHPGDRA